MSQARLISFVIPCYRSQNTIAEVIEEIEQSMAKLGQGFEIILVNDCSPDDVWSVIEAAASSKPHVTGINLVRNFGQHAALMAGYAQAKGGVIIIGDDDGQTPFDESYKLLQAINDGADVAMGAYQEGKKHNIFRNWGSDVNDAMTRYLLGKPKGLRMNSFGAMRRVIVDEILRYKHAFPFMGGLLLRATNRIVNVPVHHRERADGSSGYTFFKLLGLWMNGFTAFSVKPLRVASWIGCLVAFSGFAFGIYVLINKLTNPLAPIGWTSIMSVMLFLGGIIMLMLGLIGEYIGRIYICLNNAPQYIVREIASSQRAHEQG